MCQAGRRDVQSTTTQLVRDALSGTPRLRCLRNMSWTCTLSDSEIDEVCQDTFSELKRLKTPIRGLVNSFVDLSSWICSFAGKYRGTPLTDADAMNEQCGPGSFDGAK